MFNEASERLAAVLRGTARGEILDALLSGNASGEALPRLRRGMRSHTFPAASGAIALRQIVGALDVRTQREGLHVLQGWDYAAHRFPDEIAPVLLLDYCARLGVPAYGERRALAIMLDQYFLAILSLLTVRAWDEGDANENLDRIGALLRDLQGPEGSGQRFVDDAETLLLLAVSYYHPEEQGYDLILERVRTLDDAHRLRFALSCAAIMSGHLRWGLRFMYRRDVGLMRKDNVVDYPWLLFALLTLMRAYSVMLDASRRDDARERVVEGLLNGMSADPWAFTEKIPSFLSAFQAEHDEFRTLLGRHRDTLLAEFTLRAPDAKTYSPLAFSCNFLSNAAVARVVVALADARAGDGYASLNALFARERPGASTDGAAERLARDLMEYSVGSPERLGDGGAPLIVFDPYDAIGCFNAAMRTITASHQGQPGQ
jgi:hypothetical protein